jgi:FMN reductase
MTGGSAVHSLAVEVHLKPVLSEIGAQVVGPGLYLAGEEIDRPQPAIDRWWTVTRRPLGALLKGTRPPSG